MNAGRIQPRRRPEGWDITDAGRAALARAEAEESAQPATEPQTTDNDTLLRPTWRSVPSRPTGDPHR